MTMGEYGGGASLVCESRGGSGGGLLLPPKVAVGCCGSDVIVESVEGYARCCCPWVTLGGRGTMSVYMHSCTGRMSKYALDTVVSADG